MSENSHQTYEIWMQTALGLAQKALPKDVPVGALVLNPQGQVIGEGWNTREENSDPLGHAEIMAIQSACRHLQNWRLSDCTLVVTLEPCPMCATAMLQARIKTVIFGASDPLQGALGSALNLNTFFGAHATVIGGILEKPCQTQLDTFFKALRQGNSFS